MLEEGQIQGQLEIYDFNGQLVSKGTFQNGQLHGPYEFYDSNGQLINRGTYQNGEECGGWIKYGETRTFPSCSSNIPGSG